jgi:hypothetical protein
MQFKCFIKIQNNWVEGFPLTGITCHIFVPVPSSDLDFYHHMSWSFLCVIILDCSFCWYWWNCRTSLIKLSFHNSIIKFWVDCIPMLCKWQNINFQAWNFLIYHTSSRINLSTDCLDACDKLHYYLKTPYSFNLNLKNLKKIMRCLILLPITYEWLVLFLNIILLVITHSSQPQQILYLSMMVARSNEVTTPVDYVPFDGGSRIVRGFSIGNCNVNSSNIPTIKTILFCLCYAVLLTVLLDL